MKLLTILLLTLLSLNLIARDLDSSKIAIKQLKELDKAYSTQDAKCDALNLKTAEILSRCKSEAKKRILAKVDNIFTLALNQIEKKAKNESECVQKCQELFSAQEPPLSFNGSENCKQLNIAWKAASNLGNCGK